MHEPETQMTLCHADNPLMERGDEVPEDFPDPNLAAIFALTGCSLGQFYNGRPLRGLVWGAGGIAVFFLVSGQALGAPAGFFFLAACAIDAYSTAKEINNCIIPFRDISRLFWVEVILALSVGTAWCLSGIFGILYAG